MRFFCTLPQLHREGKCQLRTQRGTRRHMWQPYRRSNFGRKSPQAGILLAHDAQRRHRTSQKMQNLLRACQDLPSPIRATDLNHKPLAFSAVGIRHTRALDHWKRSMQICHYRSGLLHQMGRGRAIGNNHQEKGTQLRSAIYNMQVWNPKSIGV